MASFDLQPALELHSRVAPVATKLKTLTLWLLNFFADLNIALYYQISGVLSHFWNLYQMFSFQSGLSFPGWWQ